MSAFAGTANATSHDICLWDGSSQGLGSGDSCFAQGTDWLTAVNGSGGSWIYCGAHDTSGNMYASYTSGSGSCSHPYGGGNQLKGKLHVDTASTVHGSISY